MGLIEFAQSEINRAGLQSKDSDYDGMIGNAVMELVEVFAKQGHSGFSAGWVLNTFSKLANFKPITPLTYAEDEWNVVGDGVWQNKRDPSVFSRDGGATHYEVG